MKLPAIKNAVENYSLEELKAAEEAIMDERSPAIPIDGDDEGEKLTHVLAAIYIKEEMSTKSIAFRDALRAYSQRVRQSISL